MDREEERAHCVLFMKTIQLASKPWRTDDEGFTLSGRPSYIEKLTWHWPICNSYQALALSFCLRRILVNPICINPLGVKNLTMSN